ncbi:MULTISPECIES: LysR family transcriptional regulator [Kordiimonas]|jgi:LysR family transcriptional regulator AphB|uniref:Regulatory helix-turn-helix protein, lysR family n=1 Tax=Kordiimonas lacus TaxID=637679 RepID=A0A1G7B2Q3_9PROT|nr:MULTISPECIES: LysR family transcriptional regulator [Kordiimonas]SDE21379.1 regulatory helix-turn-helix protein, lysR family [Kordiimonas lacus]
MNLNDMLLFAKVAEVGGISAAATALGLPKSSVSRRIAALEDALGAALLERTTRVVKLTEFGRIFLQHCIRISEEAESAQAAAHEIMSTPRGVLRVSASTAIGQYLVAPHIGDFMASYPEIDVQLVLNNRRVDLIAEGYDLAIRVGRLEDSSLISRRLGGARAIICAAPSYIEKRGQPKRPEDLSSHTTLAMSDSNNVTKWLLENTAGDGRAVDLAPRHCVNDFTVLRTMAEGGSGIIIAPEYVVRQAIAANKLRQVLPDWRSTLIDYYLIYPSRRGLTRKAEAWIDFFADRFRKTLVKDKQ